MRKEFVFINRKKKVQKVRKTDEQEKQSWPVDNTGSPLDLDEITWFKRLLAHNIRMPLAIISGYLELLMQGNFQNRREEIACIDKITSNVDYIDTLTKVLLDSEQESLLYQREYFDVLECVQRVAAYVKVIAQKVGVEISVISSKSEVVFWGNRISLMRAFFNLIENSLRYMNKQGNICIMVEETEEEILIIYRDDGEGMEQEEVPYIGELNFRGSNGDVNGTGMGMYLVKEAVEGQDGHFSVKSSLGNGMTIYMSFPKKKV